MIAETNTKAAWSYRESIILDKKVLDNLYATQARVAENHNLPATTKPLQI
jgi:hypothetical protein